MSRARDIAYGRHSLIPDCCIQFYIDEWENHCTLNTHYQEMAHASDYNYVPCPKCFFQGIKVKIRVCEIDCKRKCWLDF